MTAPEDDLHRYLQMLAGDAAAGRLLEIRAAIGRGAMRQTFIPATRIDLAAHAISRLGAHTDVYVGVLLRHRRAGGRDACERAHLAFVEIDRLDGLQRLHACRCAPTAVVSSGSEGHVHAYWKLREPVDHDSLERANRRLAEHLGGDLASVDAARILRPPTSLNQKRTPPAPVRLLGLDPSRRYRLSELTAGLAAPPSRRSSGVGPRRTPSGDVDRQLLAIPAADYVPALCGRQANRAGKVCCPFHDDHTPSLQLYEHGWYCFGCATGGSVYDFGARLYGMNPRGHDFLVLRQRLAAELGLEQTAMIGVAPLSARTPPSLAKTDLQRPSHDRAGAARPLRPGRWR